MQTHEIIEAATKANKFVTHDPAVGGGDLYYLLPETEGTVVPRAVRELLEELRDAYETVDGLPAFFEDVTGELKDNSEGISSEDLRDWQTAVIAGFTTAMARAIETLRKSVAR
jgi:hypothetical protein